MTGNFGISSGNNVVGAVLPSSTWPINLTNVATENGRRSLNRTWSGMQDSPLLIAANDGIFTYNTAQYLKHMAVFMQSYFLDELNTGSEEMAFLERSDSRDSSTSHRRNRPHAASSTVRRSRHQPIT